LAGRQTTLASCGASQTDQPPAASTAAVLAKPARRNWHNHRVGKLAYQHRRRFLSRESAAPLRIAAVHQIVAGTSPFRCRIPISVNPPGLESLVCLLVHPDFSRVTRDLKKAKKNLVTTTSGITIATLTQLNGVRRLRLSCEPRQLVSQIALSNSSQPVQKPAGFCSLEPVPF
jgi:hypothetical protein